MAQTPTSFHHQTTSSHPTPSLTIATIRHQLARYGMRLRLSDTLSLVSRSLWIGGTTMLTIAATGWLIPIPQLWIWVVLPLVCWAVAMIGYLVLRPLPLPHIARRVDAILQLRERLATALELADVIPAHTNTDTDTDTDIRILQQRDAAHTLQTIEPRQLPWQFHLRVFLLGLITVAAAGMLLVLPNPQNDVLAEQQQVREAIADVDATIEELKEQIAHRDDLTPEEREALARQLAELQEQLRQNAGNREEALADLSSTEAQLQQQLDPNSDARRAALEQMAHNLQALSGNEQPTQSPDLAQAVKDMQQLADRLGAMSDTERQQLADSLEQMAQQTAATDPQTSQQLSDVAQSLRAGNTQQAQQQLQQAAQHVQQAQQQLQQQQTVQQTLSQVQQGRQRIAQAGQQTTQQQQASQQSQSGQQQSGQQSQSGQQQSGQQQSGQQGGGSNAANLGQDTSNTTSQVDPNKPGGGQGTPPGNTPGATIYKPFNPSSPAPITEFIPGQQGEGGTTDVQQGQSNLPGVNNASVVPYEQVYPDYARTASEALDRGYIPPHMKEYVREYFTQLEPNNQ